MVKGEGKDMNSSVLKARFNIAVDVFFKVTVGSICVSMIFMTLFWGVDVQMEVVPFLGQILIMSALCALLNLFLDYENVKSKKRMFLYIVLHYIYENIAVLGCGLAFRWFYISDWKMLLVMVAGVAVIYFGIMAFNMKKDYKTAQMMNERLRKR